LKFKDITRWEPLECHEDWGDVVVVVW